MAKKSFFERLTGATAEELSMLRENKIEPLKKVNFEKPKKTIKTTKKEPPQILEKQIFNEEWPADREGKLLIDVYQTENEMIIKSAAAGIKSENVDISITNNTVTIKGIRQKDGSASQEQYNLQEIYWGPFSRLVILPTDIDPDKARASIKDGVLTIKLLKIEKAKAKTLKVREIE